MYKMFLFEKENFKYFSLAVAFVLLKGCHGCFRSDEYQNSSIKTGSSFYVECECTEYQDSVQKLKWLDKHNKIITEGPGTDSNIFIEYTYRPDSINLHIPSVSKTMSGTYKCVTQYEGREYVHTHNLHVYDPLTFFNTSDVQNITEGENSKINCEVRSDSATIIDWYKNDKKISDTVKYNIEPEGLMINKVEKQDAGTYRCNVLAEATSEEIDKFIKVEVFTKPMITNLEAIPNRYVTVGQKLIVQCSAEGQPKPEYQWIKNSAMEPDENKNETWIQEENRIIFSEIQINDAGCYECFAFNRAGNDSSEIIIEVLAPPKIFEFKDITAVEGALVKILCEATGSSKPNITVTFESSIDNDSWDSPREIPNGSVLTVERSHEGVYTCNATNEVSYDTKSMYLKVLHKPYFENPHEEIWGWNGKTIIISCEHDSNPKALRMWRFQGSPKDEQLFVGKRILEQLTNIEVNYLPVTITKDFPYGTFECHVKNAYGNATKSIIVKEAFRPPTLTDFQVKLLTTTTRTAIFSLEAAEDFIGPKVNAYKAEYDTLENYEITSFHKERVWTVDRPCIISNLKPNTTYSARFTAINDVGEGAWSNYTVFTTLEISGPEPPIWEDEHPIYQSSSNGKLEVQWRAPESNGDPIDYYSIRYCPSDKNIEEESGNLMACVNKRLEPTTKLDLSDLDPNMTYHLEIVAHNTEGNSTAARIVVTIPASQIPEPLLSAGAIIGIAVAAVLICLILLDLMFLFWKRQGILATCFLKKNNKKQDGQLNSRDKKGLLKVGGESTDTARPNNGHKEYEYNKTTGVITGKHSSV